MARLLKENDVRPVLKLCTIETRELVLAGVNGDEDFPKLLGDYRWAMTRDYNMAVIIVAFYTYCLKSCDLEIKKFALSALREGSNSNKLFEFLKEGNGKKIKDCMRLDFMIAMDKVLQGYLVGDENKEKRAKIVGDFKNRVGKITPWRIKGGEISDLISKLLSGSNNVKLEIDRKTAEERKAKEEAERKTAEERKAKEEAERKAAEERKAKEEAERKAAEERKVEEETERKAAEERKFKEETWKRVGELLEESADLLKNEIESRTFSVLKDMAGKFKLIKDILGEQNYQNQLRELMKNYREKLSTGDKKLSEECLQAAFKNVLNITSEICDGQPYATYFVDGQPKKIKLHCDDLKFDEVVDLSSLKNQCPGYIKFNLLDIEKLKALMTKFYPNIPAPLLNLLFKFYCKQSGPKKIDLRGGIGYWPMKYEEKDIGKKLMKHPIKLPLLICISDLDIGTN